MYIVPLSLHIKLHQIIMSIMKIFIVCMCVKYQPSFLEQCACILTEHFLFIQILDIYNCEILIRILYYLKRSINHHGLMLPLFCLMTY